MNEQGSAPEAVATAQAVILVVDDDAAVRQVTARVLEREGYRVLQAGEGAEALRVAREHSGPLDLLLTDVVMPGMNGRELGEKPAAVRPETPFGLEGLASAVRDVLSV